MSMKEQLAALFGLGEDKPSQRKPARKLQEPKKVSAAPPPPTKTPPAPASVAATKSARAFNQGTAPDRPPRSARQAGGPASFILRGDSDLNVVREKLEGMIFKGETAPSTSISAESKAELDGFLEAGAAMLLARSEPDETGYIVGFDFGTSSSKLVIHQPGAGDLAYALPIPLELRVEEKGRRQDHLWRTVIWYDVGNERFSAYPVDGAAPIEGFKTRMLQEDDAVLDAGVTASEAATAYLAMIFAYAVGRHRLAAPEGFRRDAHFSRFHFGVPVSSMESSACAQGFRRVANAAMLVAGQADNLSLAEVRAALELTDPVARATAETACLLFEELSAVIAGYRASSDHRTGPHVIVDIGASTLDIATFNVLPGESHVPVFYTSVELLGSDSHCVARHLNVADDQFVRACQAQTEQVLTTTRTRRDPQFAYNNGVSKPMLFIGGGRLGDVYDAVYRGYEKPLGAPRRTPGPGQNLSFDPETDFARLLLAWGLSQEDIYLPPIKPPSEIEDFEPLRGSGAVGGYVSKDMC